METSYANGLIRLGHLLNGLVILWGIGSNGAFGLKAWIVHQALIEKSSITGQVHDE